MLAFASVLSALVAATAVQAALPATSSSERITSYNATLKSAWVSDSGQGVFTVSKLWESYRVGAQLNPSSLQDGLELLQGANGTNTTSSSIYVSSPCARASLRRGRFAERLIVLLQGVLLQFNETLGTAANGTSSGIPFVALVSCDVSATAPLEVSSTNSSAAANSTSTTNSTLSSNSTSNATAELDVFQLAASLDAVAVVLYSTANQVSAELSQQRRAQLTFPFLKVVHPQLDLQCYHYYSYLFPPWRQRWQSPAEPVRVSSLLPGVPLRASMTAEPRLSSFCSNVDADHQYFNSSLLIEASANLTGLLSTASSGAVPDTGFLLATISPTATNNTSPVVATIGRASSASPPSATATGTVPSNSPSSPASGASRTVGSAALLGLALAMGLWIQM